jgi:hypothetical protein
MQTTAGAREANVPRMPRPLKLTSLGLAPSDATPDAALNARFESTFRSNLALQIATGVQELKGNLTFFSGFAALALVAYNAGRGSATRVATAGRSATRPTVASAEWEAICRFGATQYHLLPSQVTVGAAVWQCDRNIPAWFRHVVVRTPSGLQLIAYNYLRSIRVCINSQRPARACSAENHRQRDPGSGEQVCKQTRPGALDKLYDPGRLAPAYRQALQSATPIAEDNRLLRALGSQLVKV